jgi:hypothetical protein
MHLLLKQSDIFKFIDNSLKDCLYFKLFRSCNQIGMSCLYMLTCAYLSCFSLCLLHTVVKGDIEVFNKFYLKQLILEFKSN